MTVLHIVPVSRDDMTRKQLEKHINSFKKYKRDCEVQIANYKMKEQDIQEQLDMTNLVLSKYEPQLASVIKEELQNNGNMPQ